MEFNITVKRLAGSWVVVQVRSDGRRIVIGKSHTIQNAMQKASQYLAADAYLIDYVEGRESANGSIT